MGPAPVFFFFFFFFFFFSPCVCLHHSLFYLIDVPLSPSSFIFISLCGALVVLVLVFLSKLSCTAYMVAFLALRVLYVVVLCLFRFCFLAFPPESLPGDDVLCRLRSRPRFCLLSSLSVCFFLFSPTVFVPGLWCNFLYLVTTADFVADQLIM